MICAVHRMSPGCALRNCAHTAPDALTRLRASFYAMRAGPAKPDSTVERMTRSLSAGGGASVDCALYESGPECSFARCGCAGQDAVAAVSDAASAARGNHVTGAGQSVCLSA